MSTTQHTSGPWTLRDIGTQWAISKTGARTNHAYVMRDGLDRGKANARLIATAPDLLAALEQILQACAHGIGEGGSDELESFVSEIKDIARTAIAKVQA